MTPAINIQCRPTPDVWVAGEVKRVPIIGDDKGQVVADDSGNVIVDDQ